MLSKRRNLSLVFSTILLCIASLYTFGNGTEDKEKNSLIIEAQTESTSVLPETVAAADLRSRPDIIMESYLAGYPDKIKATVFEDGEWGIEMNDGRVFYWANGRMLPAEKIQDWEQFRTYQVYPYRGTPRDPSTYTAETIERLKNYGSRESRATPALPQDPGLLNALFQVDDRITTEKHIVKTYLFNYRLSVHEDIVPAVKRIDERVKEIAQTNADVADFLDKLDSTSGYNWRVIAGTNRRSNHSYGLAIDVLPINWHRKAMYWAWIRDFNDDWMNVPQEELWTPPVEVVQVFEDEGFIWGGTWPFYDTMHFEYRPELIEIKKRVVFD